MPGLAGTGLGPGHRSLDRLKTAFGLAFNRRLNLIFRGFGTSLSFLPGQTVTETGCEILTEKQRGL